jgi:hypothetical protein
MGAMAIRNGRRCLRVHDQDPALSFQTKAMTPMRQVIRSGLR